MIKYNSYDKWGFIKKAYDALKPNEWYWLMDNDYKRKYEHIKEAVTTDVCYTSGTIGNMCADCKFMLEASDRIFKTSYAA